MGHAYGCTWRTYQCNCGFETPLAAWERELLKGEPSIETRIRERIKEIEEELSASYSLIGEATVNGNDSTDWVNSAKEKRARIWELKNVLGMMGVR